MIADASGIAVVGLAGRFARAESAEALLELVIEGRTSFSTVPSDGFDGVPVRGVLPSADAFDTSMFGMSAPDAARLDRQQRVLLEVGYSALEDACILPSRTKDVISVFIAASPSDDDAFKARASAADSYSDHILKSTKFSATRLSYTLGLRGESILIDTACSSSLVAVHMACESLRSGRSDIVIAGGVSIPSDQEYAYVAEEGMVGSPTGEMLPFDRRANGAVPGSGCGLVILMRLDDAVKQRRRIRAVISGSAVNNDGATKLGFMAPSGDGQAEVIAMAQAMADATPPSIQYVETHGTGTAIGDAVEVDALMRVFGRSAKSPWCDFGAVKANIGHLDRAAGVASLIKVVLLLEERVIPPVAGLVETNPMLALEGSPFRLPVTARPWPPAHPRRAAVSAFGVGGTNCHVVVDEAPASPITSQEPASRARIIAVSAATENSLQATCTSLQEALDKDSGPQGFATLERTQCAGRTQHVFRRGVAARSAQDAAQRLAVASSERSGERGIVFAFAGQGQPIVDGLRGLFEDSRFTYEDSLVECAERIRDSGGPDILSALFDEQLTGEDRSRMFRAFTLYQPALFAVQWALAQEWRRLGVEPMCVVGHSVGEVTAACMASVLSVDDAVRLVVERGKAMDRCPAGAMLSVRSSKAVVAPLLRGIRVKLAVENAEDLIVLSGDVGEIDRAAQRLAGEGVQAHSLDVGRAAHSQLMDPAAKNLATVTRTMHFGDPAIPFPRNLTGRLSTPAESDSEYWSRHLVEPVQFLSCLREIAGLDTHILLEIGPGDVLCRIAEQVDDFNDWALLSSDIPRGEDHGDSSIGFLDVAAQLWSFGVPVDIESLVDSDSAFGRGSVYEFDHDGPAPSSRAPTEATAPTERDPDSAQWLYERAWVQRDLEMGARGSPREWIVTDEGAGLGLEIARALRHEAHDVHMIEAASLDARHSGFDGCDVVETLAFRSGSWATSASLYGSFVQALPKTTQHVWSIRPSQGESLAPAAFSLAAQRVVPLERDDLRWSSVEISSSRDVAQLASVLSMGRGEMRLLGGNRLEIPTFIHSWPGWTMRPLRTGGRYVVTGGLGQVGSALAEAMLTAVPCHVLMLGRSNLATRKQRRERLERVAAGNGSSVTYSICDVADIEQVAETCRQFEQEAGGAINGFIHAAGHTDTSDFRFFEEIDESVADLLGAAKVHGAEAIASVLTPAVDFVVLCSSLSTLLGGLRFGAYVAANAWLEALAEARWRAGDERWIAVAWDAWLPEERRRSSLPLSDPVSPYALSRSEGAEALQRALSSRVPVLAVSTTDLVHRMDQVRKTLHVTPPSVAAPDEQVKPREAIRSAVQSVLQRTDIEDDDDLTALGVDSLSMLRILGRARQMLRRSISTAHALRHPTIAGISSGVTDRDPPLEVAVTKPATSYPATPVQRRWLELATAGYGSIDVSVRISGGIDPQRLVRSVEQVLDRHSGLRTVFSRTPEGWRQRVANATSVGFVDLSVGGAPRIRDVSAALASEPFDLGHQAPFRVCVADHEDQATHLLIHAHHAVFDGWSSSIFMRDLDAAYSGVLARDRPHQYVDYAVALESYIAQGGFSRARADFAEMFRDRVSITRMPRDYPLATPSSWGEVLRTGFDRRRGAALDAAAKRGNRSSFTLLMTAFLLMLHEETGESDLVVGTTTAGRHSPETEEIVGVFVNPLPVRFSIHGDMSIFDVLTHVENQLALVLEHGMYPLEDLVSNVEAFRGCGLNETFFCYLLFQSYWRPEATIGGFPYRVDTPDPNHHHRLMRELEVVVDRGDDDTLSFELWFQDDLFAAGSAQAWRESFLHLVDILARLAGQGDDQSVARVLAVPPRARVSD